MSSPNQSRDWYSASRMVSNQQIRQHLRHLEQLVKDMRDNCPWLLGDASLRKSIHQCRQELAAVRKYGNDFNDQGSRLGRALNQLEAIEATLNQARTSAYIRNERGR